MSSDKYQSEISKRFKGNVPGQIQFARITGTTMHYGKVSMGGVTIAFH